MPNWTFNQITTSNPSILPTFIDDKGNFDFNKLIPMPESLEIEDGSITDEAIAYFLTDRLTKSVEESELIGKINNMFHSPEKWAEIIVSRLSEKNEWNKKRDWDKLYELGKQYIFNFENYGCRTWYEWCNQYWGTKWNACDTSYDESKPVVVEFDTAWSAPEPIFEKMCEMFPNDEIEFYCEYEDGFVNKYANNGGTLELTEEYELPDEDEEEDE